MEQVTARKTALALALIFSQAFAFESQTLVSKVLKQVPEKSALAASEALDLSMYSRIRDEGFEHSHVMEYAAALSDDIGPRLTGSPAMSAANEWTRAQLAAMGCSNAHLESWGEFGMAWTQVSAQGNLMRY